MKAIVLSPGPSLTATFHGDRADLLIGVNRAATRYLCDVWVCGDLPLILQEDLNVIGAPLLVAYGVSLDNLRDRAWKWRGEQFAWTPIAESWLHTSVVNWPWCSFCSAIVYAAYRGAKEITVYGADWEGTADFDGTQAGKNRSEDRWKYERQLFKDLSVILKDKCGCEVRRVQPVPAMIDGYA